MRTELFAILNEIEHQLVRTCLVYLTRLKFIFLVPTLSFINEQALIELVHGQFTSVSAYWHPSAYFFEKEYKKFYNKRVEGKLNLNLSMAAWSTSLQKSICFNVK